MPDEPAKSHGGGAASGFVAGFAPWIVYWILSGSTSFETAVGISFVIAVLGNVLTLARGKPLMVLEVGNAIAFAGLAIVGLAAGDAWVSRWIQPLGNAALFTIMLTSVLIRRPFTLQYAKAATPPDLWDSPGFLAVNTMLTWVWIAAMGTMTVLALVPPIVQGDATRDDGGSDLSILFYWVLPYAVLGLTILFTVKFPDWFGAEFDDATPVVGTRQTPISTSLDHDTRRVGELVMTAGPQGALLDEAISARVTGASPGESVTIRATNVDLVGNLWRSSAAFTADENGSVDTRRVAPVSGDYVGADAGGLVWAMRFATEGATPQIYLPPGDATGFAIEATIGDAVLTRTLVRRSVAPDVNVRDIHDDSVIGRLFLPPGDGPFPGVVLFGGSEGGVDSQHSNAALLASRGFAALIVGYFGLDGLDHDLASIPLERLAHGVRALAAHPAVDGTRVGALAISRGSEGLLSMAALIDDVPVAAVVAVSPSCVSWTAIGNNGTLPGVPSWTVGGQPVAHLDVADRVLMEGAMRDALRDRGRRNPLHPHVLHLARAYETALDDPDGAAAAAIPVERIAAPLLLISGSDDEVWPSGPMAERIIQRRREHNTAQRDAHRQYDGAGHLMRLGCLPTDVTETSGIALGGTREGIAAAQADATALVLDFFRTML